MNNIFKMVEDFFNLAESIYALIKNSNFLNAQREFYPFVPADEIINSTDNNFNYGFGSFFENENVFQDILKENNKNTFNYSKLYFSKDELKNLIDTAYEEKPHANNDENFLKGSMNRFSDFYNPIFSENFFRNDNSINSTKKDKEFKNINLEKYIEIKKDDIKGIEISDEIIDKIGEKLSFEIQEAALNRSIL